jgi:hypothetical protein
VTNGKHVHRSLEEPINIRRLRLRRQSNIGHNTLRTQLPVLYSRWPVRVRSCSAPQLPPPYDIPSMGLLPVELYRPIVKQVGRKSDLCSLATVSRTLQFEAERIIWRKVEACKVETASGICKSIGSAARLGPYVIALDMQVEFYARHPDTLAFLASVAKALSRMISLTDLTLLLFYYDASSFCWPFGNHFTFKLQSLYSSFTLDDFFYPFLETQPQLRTWKLRANGAGIPQTPFPKHILPNLAWLATVDSSFSPHIPSAIISERPVTHLCIRDHWQNHQFNLMDLALSKGPIRALHFISGPEGPGNPYMLLSTYVPSLELLSGLTFQSGWVRCPLPLLTFSCQ